MTKSEFIALKKKGCKPQFRDIIGMQPAPEKSPLLVSFCEMMHPGQKTIHSPGGVQVFSKNDTFVYRVFNRGIMKTKEGHWLKQEQQTFYPF